MSRRRTETTSIRTLLSLLSPALHILLPPSPTAATAASSTRTALALGLLRLLLRRLLLGLLLLLLIRRLRPKGVLLSCPTPSASSDPRDWKP